MSEISARFRFFYSRLRPADIVNFEVVTDIGFMDIPQCFFDALTFLYNENGDATLYFGPSLEPKGIDVHDAILSASPADLAVGQDARLRRRP